MTAITVLKFNTEGGAENTLGVLKNLAKQQLLTLLDAALVTWPTGKEKPETKQLTNLAGSSTLDGAFWGLLFGLIFFVPLLGVASATGTGDLSGSFTDVGIDDNFIKSARKTVTEGTSALFLMTCDVVLDSVSEAMKGLDFEMISSNLSREQEERLIAAFIHK